MKDSFILFAEYSEQFNMLSNEQAGILIKAIFAYSTDKELPEMDSITKLAFSFIRSALDRSDDKYQRRVEANRENGKLGGRPRKSPKNEIEAIDSEADNGEQKPKSEPKITQHKTQDNPIETQKPNGFFKNPPEREREYERDNNIFITHTARMREDDSSRSEELKELPSRTVDKDFSKRFSAFVNRWNIEVDTNSPLLADFDYEKLNEAFSKSEKFLQRYSSYKFLSWIIKNYNSIIKGKYDDHKKEEGAESKPKIKLPWDEGDIVVLKAGED